MTSENQTKPETVVNMNKSYTILISLIVALGGFLLGFDSAVISGAVKGITIYFEMTEWMLGFSVGCVVFGAMAGNLLAGPMADKFGRKKVLIVVAALFTISASWSALATGYVEFITARIIGGIGIGGAILIAPIYIAEIAPPKLRGSLVSFNQLNIVIGISAIVISAYSSPPIFLRIFLANSISLSFWMSHLGLLGTLNSARK